MTREEFYQALKFVPKQIFMYALRKHPFVTLCLQVPVVPDTRSCSCACARVRRSDHVLSDEQLLALFDEADTDRSGALSWPQFKEALVRRGFGVEFTRVRFFVASPPFVALSSRSIAHALAPPHTFADILRAARPRRRAGDHARAVRALHGHSSKISI